MYRLIWVFADHTGLIVGFVVRWLICLYPACTQLRINVDATSRRFVFAEIVLLKLSQQTHDVTTTSLQRRCNIMTLQRRCNHVVATLFVCWVLSIGLHFDANVDCQKNSVYTFFFFFFFFATYSIISSQFVWTLEIIINCDFISPIRLYILLPENETS